MVEEHTHLCFTCTSIPGVELKSDQRLRILSGGRQLQISSAERTDTASYTCTASSAAGTTSKEYSLQVYGTYKPVPGHLLIKAILLFALHFITETENNQSGSSTVTQSQGVKIIKMCFK